MYAFWEYWNLYHKVTFDGINKIITVNAGVTDISIKTDVYSDWKEWLLLEDYSKYPPALRTIGGDPTISGQYAGDIYFTMNGWRLQYDPTKVKVVGALFSDDYDSAYIGTDGIKVYPAQVASIVTVVTADLGSLAIPTATENASAVRTNLTTELARIDVSVGTRSSQASVDSVQTSVNNVQATVNAIETDVNAIALDITNIFNVVTDIRKYHRNRTKIDPLTYRLYVYDDDNTTILRTFDLKNKDGVASFLEIFERVVV